MPLLGHIRLAVSGRSDFDCSKDAIRLIWLANLSRHLHLKRIDEVQQFLKKNALRVLKDVFRHNPEFFYGHYGRYVNINVSIILVLSSDDERFSAFTRPVKSIFAKFKHGTREAETKLVSVQDPRNVEIFVSAKYLVLIIFQNDFKDIELTIIHELTHWFTKNIFQGYETGFKGFWQDFFREHCVFFRILLGP